MNTCTCVRLTESAFTEKREGTGENGACMHSLTPCTGHAFYFHPYISNDSYLLDQMSITETSYIFEFVGEDLQNMISFEYI